MINNLYCNYLTLGISTKILKNKKKIIYNKYSLIIIKNAIINNISKKIDIK